MGGHATSALPAVSTGFLLPFVNHQRNSGALSATVGIAIQPPDVALPLWDCVSLRHKPPLKGLLQFILGKPECVARRLGGGFVSLVFHRKLFLLWRAF